MVTRIRTILKSVAQAWGLEPAARLALAREVWPKAVGEPLTSSSAPVSIRGARLAVGVTHVAVGQEIRLRRAAILQVLAGELGEGVITDLVTVPRRYLTDTRRPAGRRAR